VIQVGQWSREEDGISESAFRETAEEQHRKPVLCRFVPIPVTEYF